MREGLARGMLHFDRREKARFVHLLCHDERVEMKSELAILETSRKKAEDRVVCGCCLSHCIAVQTPRPRACCLATLSWCGEPCPQGPVRPIFNMQR